MDNRDKVIVKTSAVGIITNILLVFFKMAVGFISNSIAVILDAVNNLSDVLSSVITIIGTKMARKKPDKEHPFGHGRIEYLSAMIVSGIVLYAGITSAVESVRKIIHPEKANYSVVSLVIIAVAVVVKIWLGNYVKAQGKKVNSGSLIASGSDAMFDAVLSASVLVSAILFLISGISLEAYVGAVISGFIIKSGIAMIIVTLNEILGMRADSKISSRIKEILGAEPRVKGVYDLIMYNYGPGRDFASVHLELPDNMTVREVDLLTRRVKSKVYDETGVVLAGVGVHSYNTASAVLGDTKMIDGIRNKVLQHSWVMELHGFYLDIEKREIWFDVVMSFDIEPAEGLKRLYDEMESLYPDYIFYISRDVDFSD